MDPYEAYGPTPGYYGSSTTDLRPIDTLTSLTSSVPQHNLAQHDSRAQRRRISSTSPTSSSYTNGPSTKIGSGSSGSADYLSSAIRKNNATEPGRHDPSGSGFDSTTLEYASASTSRHLDDHHLRSSQDPNYHPSISPNYTPNSLNPATYITSDSRLNSSPASYRGTEDDRSIPLSSVRPQNDSEGQIPGAPPVPTSGPTFLNVDETFIRKPSIARRMFEKGSKSLQRMKTGRRKDEGAPDGNYNKIDEDEEDEEEGYGFDLTAYDADFLKPHTKANSTSYDEYRRSALVKGITIDLSDDYGLQSRSTGLYSELNIPVDPNPPNWKPWEIRLPYLLFLNILTLALIGMTEYLIRLSQYLGDPGLLRYTSPQDVSLVDWFAWKYLPTVVGVVYGVLWEITDTEVKRVEPYYQMSRPEGATAGNSLNVEYFTFWNFLAPLQALRYTQWAVLTSSTAWVMSYAFIPNLLSAILNVNDEANEADNNPDVLKKLVIDVGYARGLQACLGIVLIAGISLMWELGRRKSGLVGDVSGIAGIAAMANKSHVLMDFKDLDDASEKRIHFHLNKRRYRLYKMSLYLGDNVKKEERIQFKESKFMHLFKKKGPRSPQPTILTLYAGVPILLFLAFVLSIMPVLAFETRKSHPILIKIPFIAVALGTIIKSIWGVLDKDLRTIQPFHSLSLGNAPPNTLTLDYTGTVPGWVTVKALRNGHWLLALITFNSVLIEIFTVTMGSFLNRSVTQEETIMSIRVSYGLSTVICCSLMISYVVAYYFRRIPFLPRQPGTISSVLTFIHQSKMVTDFTGMEFWQTKEREAKLMEIGKRYAFGWFVGRDNKIHLGIDQEQIKGKYKWGVDFKAGVIDEQVGNYDRY